MGTRSKAIVAVGLGVLVAVAALGGQAYMGADRYPKAWEEQTIGSMTLSEDRRTLFVLADPYLSASCYEGRADVAADGERWTVVLEARRTQDLCTLEGCIDDAASPVARQLAAGETPGCTTAAVELDRAVPPDVEVVPA